MVVIVPSYNNAPWYQRNLDSIATQKYSNFRVVYIDDHSSDGTGDFVREYICKRQWKNRVTLICNPERKGALANIYSAVWECAPEEIVVTVDGDDWLLHDCTLSLLNEVYSHSDVWMTYGQYVESPGGGAGHCQMIPEEVISTNSFRSYAWVSSHLRTFYAALFQKIPVEDLCCYGQFYSVAWDLAFMFPMLEMAKGHFCFIPQVLYVYNQANPLNDYKLRRELQIYFESIIRDQPPYFPIETLFDE